MAGRRAVSPEQVEIARLRADLSRARMEISILKKAAAYFAREPVKYAFILAEPTAYPLSVVCRVLREHHGYTGSLNRIQTLMRALGLRTKAGRKYKATKDSTHALPVAPILLGQDFSCDTRAESTSHAKTPNQVWLSDITYLWTREGWLYVCAALYLFTRRIVGWAIAEHMTRQLLLAFQQPLRWAGKTSADIMIAHLLGAISGKVLPIRPGRVEPHAIKRSPKPYKLLSVPRQIAREQILQKRATYA